MIPSSARSRAIPTLLPVYEGGWRIIQTIPSAASSVGSQSEWSISGKFAMNPSDATGRSMRNPLTEMPSPRSCAAADTVRCSSAILAMP